MPTDLKDVTTQGFAVLVPRLTGVQNGNADGTKAKFFPQNLLDGRSIKVNRTIFTAGLQYDPLLFWEDLDVDLKQLSDSTIDSLLSIGADSVYAIFNKMNLRRMTNLLSVISNSIVSYQGPVCKRICGAVCFGRISKFIISIGGCFSIWRFRLGLNAAALQ